MGGEAWAGRRGVTASAGPTTRRCLLGRGWGGEAWAERGGVTASAGPTMTCCLREGVGGGDGISRADDNTLPAREGGRGWHQPGRRRCACCALFVSLGFTLFSTSD